MNRLTQQQTRRNVQSRDSWERFAAHREVVTNLLCQAARAAGDSLCVLGAGNCNDLDLNRLRQSFRRIDLVDLDAVAMRNGLIRQGLATADIALHGGIDVTGVADRLAGWTPSALANDAEVAACVAAIAQTPPPIADERFHVCASVCLLSQLVELVVHSLGEQHPRFIELMTCVRLQHLRHLLAMTASGGKVMLITDVVSSVTCPELLASPATAITAVVRQALSQRNFFTGVNPLILKSLFESDPVLAPDVRGVRLVEPWVWDFGPRVYAVCALEIDRR